MKPPRRPAVPVSFVVDSRADLPDVGRHAPHPPVDVVDDGERWRLVFEVAGAAPEGLGIDIKGRVVTVRGFRRPTAGESGCFLRVERSVGLFERALELPEEPDPERATASFSDGLLTLEIPKLSAPKGRTIPIAPGPAKGH
jgi:HSP20 family protein